MLTCSGASSCCRERSLPTLPTCTASGPIISLSNITSEPFSFLCMFTYVRLCLVLSRRTCAHLDPEYTTPEHLQRMHISRAGCFCTRLLHDHHRVRQPQKQPLPGGLGGSFTTSTAMLLLVLLCHGSAESAHKHTRCWWPHLPVPGAILHSSIAWYFGNTARTAEDCSCIT